MWGNSWIPAVWCLGWDSNLTVPDTSQKYHLQRKVSAWRFHDPEDNVSYSCRQLYVSISYTFLILSSSSCRIIHLYHFTLHTLCSLYAINWPKYERQFRLYACSKAYSVVWLQSFDDTDLGTSWIGKFLGQPGCDPRTFRFSVILNAVQPFCPLFLFDLV